MLKSIFKYSIITLGLFSLFSCSDDENGTARVEVRLTDAPADYEEVNINVENVRLNLSSDESEEGWKDMEGVESGMYNLLELTGGVDALLANNELPAGYLSQIRLVLGDGNNLVVDGTEYALSTPSAQSSGLKINLQQELLDGITYKILLDFDVAKSIVEKGNGGYSLKPVIRAMAEAQTGAVLGQVNPVVQSMAYAIVDADTIASAATSEEGIFFLRGLEAANYKVAVVPATDSGYATVEEENVEVTIGEVNDLGVIDLSEL
ncbi:DUF4382 domain-containing protein [Sediminitomix flava]|uniref:Uncharacterized protein DUF4382 n=1 Tax=Sediminitomix flava TaxID=379075 RepID=A0A315Z8Y3_SEDFL|nr:DUF4382 domain-containing protein [Sediminitomix flava]PWJ41752.1 uncharacterized protein DUF4382 [Sediminitomix flava]